MKHKITATVQWEIETREPDVVKAASVQLQKMLPNLVSGRILKIDNLKPRRQKKIIGSFAVNDVFPFITNEEERRDYFVDGSCHSIRMNSQRYFIFKACPSCVSCGIVGNKFILEQNPNDKSPHFNFYAVHWDGSMVLMTKDHINPRSHGGENIHSNYQTMCSICNNLKGSYNLKIEGLRQIRNAYNENKKNLTKKQLNNMLLEMRQELQFPIKEKKDLCGIWTAKTDLAILRIDNDLKVVPIYETSNYPQIACVKKGSALETDKPEQFVFDRLPESSMCQRGIESCFNDEKLFVPEFLVKKI